MGVVDVNVVSKTTVIFLYFPLNFFKTITQTHSSPESIQIFSQIISLFPFSFIVFGVVYLVSIHYFIFVVFFFLFFVFVHSLVVHTTHRYGAELITIDSFTENNVTLSLVHSNDVNKRLSNKYWLGLASLDDLRTNTLESAAGTLVSQYSGFWSLKQPNPQSGECVAVTSESQSVQSWELDTCESLLPFMCKSTACPQSSVHCSNGDCVNQAFKCDGHDGMHSKRIVINIMVKGIQLIETF